MSGTNRRRGANERIFDLSLGLTIWGWTLVPIFREGIEAHLDMVSGAVFALNVCVGGLFIARWGSKTRSSVWEMMGCLPGVLVGAVAVHLAPEPKTWPVVLQLLFAGGVAFAIASFSFLGRNFAVLPALRQVTSSGPYRLLRHPAYAGELVMTVAAALSIESLALGSTIAALTVLLVVGRVLVEERHLRQSAEYRDYAERVRWRLVPGMW